eukprot:CAMPEP_0168607806 /NCGR_PEP_ID=MMETSP0449_2-20121227/262_1 /TAXON_ID=1082188 /ORGANISM="Strombidium rassoulzadegani, Strain ras09" /LENGTH=60 /DNA_ID=CAMNT_0008647693 /DNA_START=139 /DNA_END=321 /DNA_ORIENTATION=+
MADGSVGEAIETDEFNTLILSFLIIGAIGGFAAVMSLWEWIKELVKASESENPNDLPTRE